MSDRLLKESDVLRAVDNRIKELSIDPQFVRKHGIIDVMGVKKHILAIPSADRPRGVWIDKGDYAECSNCGADSGTQFDGVEPVPYKTKFCHNCGARMGGEDNETTTV